MRKKDNFYVKLVVVIIIIVILYYLYINFIAPNFTIFSDPPKEATPAKVARKLFRGK